VYMFTTRPLLRDHITLPIIYTLAIFNEYIFMLIIYNIQFLLFLSVGLYNIR